MKPVHKRSWIRRHPVLALLSLPALILVCILASWIPHAITLLTQPARLVAATTPLALAQAATINGHGVTVDGNDMTAFVQVSEILDLHGTNLGYQDSIQEDCFSVQRAFWHRYPKLEELDMWIYGPMVDRETQQDAGIGAMGHCFLQSANAENMPWDDLDDKGAWTAYNDAGFSLVVQK